MDAAGPGDSYERAARASCSDLLARDSIGWWDGDTLVVETRNFTPSDRTRIGVDGVYLVSPRTIVTERFTRISDEEIVYRFTVEDPTWYERPWTGETHFTRSDDRMIEAACHEGNYTMRFMLEAAARVGAEEGRDAMRSDDDRVSVISALSQSQ